MSDNVQCDVCGRWLDDSQNASGFTNAAGGIMNLCALYHEAAKRVARRERVNWRVFAGEGAFPAVGAAAYAGR